MCLHPFTPQLGPLLPVVYSPQEEVLHNPPCKHTAPYEEPLMTDVAMRTKLSVCGVNNVYDMTRRHDTLMVTPVGVSPFQMLCEPARTFPFFWEINTRPSVVS